MDASWKQALIQFYTEVLDPSYDTNPLTTLRVSFRLILILFTGYEKKSRQRNDYREPWEC